LTTPLNKKSVRSLLILYNELMNELRRRKVIRSTNNPVGDYTEHLVKKKLDLSISGGSTAGFDAKDNKGRRYQIKGRRVTKENRSTELSAIRNLKKKPFDFLIAVVYKQDFSVDYVAKLTCSAVKKHAGYSKHVNAWRLQMRRSLLNTPGVIDITKKFKA
jgi:hypothetical protein